MDHLILNVLVKIKRTILEGRYYFSNKANDEMEGDGLTRLDVAESIINAEGIYKTIRSRSPHRRHSSETLYVIIGLSFTGLEIYTKGKFVKREDKEQYYFLISSKKSGQAGDYYET